jgi:hypothetical protein
MLQEIQQPITNYSSTTSSTNSNFIQHEIPSDNQDISVHDNSNSDDFSDSYSDSSEYEEVRGAISSSEEEDNSDVDFSLELRKWTLKHNVNHSALRDLLKSFKKSKQFPELPVDPRTLMCTPQTVNISNLSGGKYFYFGIFSQLKYRIQCGLNLGINSQSLVYRKLQSQVTSSLVSISVGIDGIPVTRSTDQSFWPILGVVDQSLNQKPFVIALFYGESKPVNLDFLNDFVEECSKLEKDGIFVNHHYSFRISKLLCDAPARGFIKNCKSYNAYGGCEKCKDEGEWIGRIVHKNLTFTSRTDEEFRQKTDKSHHKGDTVLTKLNLELVSQVPFDYLHLVCLGVVRKLFRQWVKGKIPYKLRSRETILIGQNLKNLRNNFPDNFQRKPRCWLHIDQFKGTEFRTLLLYTGVSVLRGVIDNAQYKNFLNLHCAMFILLSRKADDPSWNKLAKQLLQKFVKKSIALYGPEFAVFNVHGLLHLHEDALLFGSLNNASTFAFESYMQNLKLFMHSNSNVLEQVTKRIIEEELLQKSQSFKISANKKVSQRKMCKDGNNCYRLKDGRLVLLKKFVKKDEILYYISQQFETLEPVKYYPFNSTKLGIFYAGKISNVKKNVTTYDLDCKYVCLPYKSYFICIPLLHEIN